MNKVTIFKYEENKLVRTMSINDEPWFVLKDVCDVLGLSNSRMVSDRLDDDEKGVSQIYTLGGSQMMSIISESGLYNVILRSDKPEAKPFRKWVTAVVLPSIRKNGGYIAGQGEAFPAGAYGKGAAGRPEDSDRPRCPHQGADGAEPDHAAEGRVF
jgi:prophage antirepressor-like protein